MSLLTRVPFGAIAFMGAFGVDLMAEASTVAAAMDVRLFSALAMLWSIPCHNLCPPVRTHSSSFGRLFMWLTTPSDVAHRHRDNQRRSKQHLT